MAKFITDDNCIPDIVIMDEDEYGDELLAKLSEEVEELTNALYEAVDSKQPILSEFADVYEVLESIMALAGITQEEVMAAKEVKKREKGGFDMRLKLISITYPDDFEVKL